MDIVAEAKISAAFLMIPASSSPVRATVLAIIVAYNRSLDEIQPWRAIYNAIAAPDTPGDGFRIVRALIYENSRSRRIEPLDHRIAADYIHDSSNGGTAAAYIAGLRIAEAHKIPWLLLLDHDTDFSSDLLSQAGRLAGNTPDSSVAAFIPRIVHGNRIISPAKIAWTGSILPIKPDETLKASSYLTAISSGALLKAESFREILPLPAGLWLDYVDHYVFLKLQRSGGKINILPITLKHDLSVLSPAGVGRIRLISILDGEAAFYRQLSYLARAVYPIRILARILKLATTNRKLALEAARWAILQIISQRAKEDADADHRHS